MIVNHKIYCLNQLKEFVVWKQSIATIKVLT